MDVIDELDPNLAIFQFIGQQLGVTEAEPLTDDQAALREIIARRVYAGLAPPLDPDTEQKPTYPLVTVSEVTSRNSIVIGGETSHVNALIDVKITGDAGLGQLSPGVTLIKRLLHQQTAGIEDVYIMGCHWESTRILPAKPDGNDLYHAVVLSFRIRANTMQNP